MIKKGSKCTYTTRALLAVLFLCIFAIPSSARAESSPRLANYYLNWSLTATQAQSLARWDLVILDVENQFRNPDMIRMMRRLNPDITILAYLTPQEIRQDASTAFSTFRNDLHTKISPEWYLKSQGGSKLTWWPGTYVLNVTNQAPRINGKRFNEFLVDYVVNNVFASGLWDGVFYDNAWDGITYFVGNDVDVNADGRTDANIANAAWQEGMRFIYNETGRLAPDKIIIGNGTTRAYRNDLNGMLIENFIAPAWGPTMETYKFNNGEEERINILNSNAANGSNGQTDYRNMRFGLGSTLLEDGYYSYDSGDRNHGQLWWYDEYNVDLGEAQSDAISNSGHETYEADVWHRDFENGLSIVNSTNETKKITLDGEYEKIHGTQDASVNDGSIISEVEIPATDGLILLKTFSQLDDVVFTNGSFARFFDKDGNRTRNGFFVFDEQYKGGDKVLHIDMDGNGKKDLLVASGPKLMAWRDDGQLFMKLYPYTVNYKGELRIAVGDLYRNGFLSVIVAPSNGYNAPIKVYTRHGALIKDNWYPFGLKYSGGYHATVADFGDDFGKHIVIGSGEGREPLAEIFDYAFDYQKRWYAFEASFRGGIDVASADLNGDFVDEVVVGAGPGKEPIIRVFDKDGNKLSEFKAYTSLIKSGIQVDTVDVDFDGVKDIIGFSDGPGL